MADVVEMGLDECWDLARSQPVCRVAWESATGPSVVPVNHIIHQRTVWFRTSAFAELNEVDDERIAVQIDESDIEKELGWSVQLRGVAHLHWHTDGVPGEVQALRAWGSGPRPIWVELEPDHVQGRRLVAAD